MPLLIIREVYVLEYVFHNFAFSASGKGRTSAFYTYIYYLKNLASRINQIYLAWLKDMHARRIIFYYISIKIELNLVQ